MSSIRLITSLAALDGIIHRYRSSEEGKFCLTTARPNYFSFFNFLTKPLHKTRSAFDWIEVHLGSRSKHFGTLDVLHLSLGQWSYKSCRVEARCYSSVLFLGHLHCPLSILTRGTKVLRVLWSVLLLRSYWPFECKWLGNFMCKTLGSYEYFNRRNSSLKGVEICTYSPIIYISSKFEEYPLN